MAGANEMRGPADWIEWRMKRSLVAAQAMPASYEALCES